MENLSSAGEDFSTELLKLHSMCLLEPWEEKYFFLQNISDFLHRFRTWSEIFQKFYSIFCGRIVKTEYHVSNKGTLWGKIFSLKKRGFSVKFGKWAQKYRIFVKKFPLSCQKGVQIVWRIILRRTRCLTKFLYLSFPDNERKIFVFLPKTSP